MDGRLEKVLNASDTERLVVTTAMLAILPPVDPDRDIAIRVLDHQTLKFYEFKLSARHGKYPKAVFQSRDWKVFVQDRGAAAGDVLYFWAHEDPVYRTNYRLALYKAGLFPGPQ